MYSIGGMSPEGINKGVGRVLVDGKLVGDGLIKLVNDRSKHQVEVTMGLGVDPVLEFGVEMKSTLPLKTEVRCIV